jgi:hypothetical protein
VRDVYGSTGELLEKVADGRPVTREPFAKNVDSLSGSPFETVVLGDGSQYVLKHLSQELDWIMRAMGDGAAGRPPFVALLWRYGLLDALPDVIEHTIVGVSHEPGTGHCAVLMRDIGAHLVAPGGDRIPLAQHRRFLDHMAAMHARFWGFEDRWGLLPPGGRYTVLTPAMSAREEAAGRDDPIPRYVATGWPALHEAAPDAFDVGYALAADPRPLVAALAETPATLVHGDWKYGNLGSAVDGRTILLDWAWPGRAGPCVDLAWYLAVNCDRLPESKEDATARLRKALEHHGVSTQDWWDRQLELALVGGFVQLGWSKTHDPVELDWWVRRIVGVGRDLLR